MQKLLRVRKATAVVCYNCEKLFDLWDNLEILFASDEVRAQVEGMQAEDVVRLDSRRKGKLLALEVAARINSADQKCFEIPEPRITASIWSWSSPMMGVWNRTATLSATEVGELASTNQEDRWSRDLRH